MNKLLILTLLTFITLGHGFQHGRDFLTSFFQHAQGINVPIGECLDSQFDDELRNATQHWNQGNFALFAFTVPIIFSEVAQKCPFKEFADLFYLVQKRFFDGVLDNNLLDKILKIARIALDEYENPYPSGASLGRDFGKMIKILITKPKSQFYSFLEAKTTTNSENGNIDTFKIFKGLFSGLSNTSFKCVTSISNGEVAIRSIIAEVKRDFENGEPLEAVITSAGLKIILIKDILVACRFLDLAQVFTNVLTENGLLKIANQIDANVDPLLSAAGKLKEGISNKKDDEIGLNAGKIAKALLNVFVN